MNIRSFAKDLVFGKKLRERMLGGDVEYNRKAALLMTIIGLAFAMLPVFACMSLVRGDLVHASINAATLLLVLLGYLQLRLRGEPQLAATIVITLLCVQFVTDFDTNVYRAMWSYTVPGICYFLLGTRWGTAWISGYWGLAVLLMLFGEARQYTFDFKVRFMAIFFCMTVGFYFFESIRQQTQRKLQENRGLLLAMFDHMNSGVAVYTACEDGRDFIFKDFNPAAERITRISRSQALGRRLLKLFPNMEKAGLTAALRRVWRTGRAERLPPFYYQDGVRQGWRENSLYKLPSGEVVAIFEDVTERMQATEQLRASENRLKEAQAIGRIGNWEFDLAAKKIIWSDQVYVLYERDPALGPPAPAEEAVYYSPEQTAALRDYVRRAVEQGESFEYDLTAKLPSGKSAHFAASMHPEKDASGRVVKLFGTVQDITERKQAEAGRQFLLQTATDFIELPAAANIYDYIAEKTRILAGDFIVSVMSFNEATQTFTTEALAGLGELAERVLHLLGRDPVGMTYPIHDRARQALVSGSLTKIEENFYELTFRRIPQPVCEVIERLYDYQGAYAMGFTWQNRLYGAITILGRKEKALQDKELIAAFVRQASMAVQRRESAEALRASQAQLSNALDMARLGPWEYNVADDRFTFNDHFYKIYRTTVERVGGYTMSSAEYARRFVHPDDAPLVGEETRKAIEATDPHFSRQLEHRMLYADGTAGHVSVRLFIIKDARGKTVRTYGVNQDITERKQAEMERRNLQTQLLQAQKMESVGRLAGGMAHDINNLLTAINGSVSLAQREVEALHPAYQELSQAGEVIKKAGDIVRQLLVFSRKQAPDLIPVDLRHTVRSMQRMLGHMISEDVHLAADLPEELGLVLCDEGGMEQAVMNLAVNARDAMPGGGRLTIAARNVEIDEEYCRRTGGARPGAYVQLSVRDTGVGMTEQVRQHLFEPFFTTKEPGKGTGLGLSVVYGIVQQHQGWITVESLPGQGSEFSLFFPVVKHNVVVDPNPAPAAVAPAGPAATGRRVLLVEDQAELLEVFARLLTQNGYTVVPARNALEAMRLFEQEAGALDLIVSDVKLPDMSGIKAVAQMFKDQPRVPVLFVSGYSDDQSGWEVIREQGYHFLQKPYTIEQLLEAMRKAMGQKSANDERQSAN